MFLLCLLFVCSPAVLQSTLESNVTTILDHVNRLRYIHSVPPVTWSSTMAAQAQTWTNNMAMKKRLSHSNYAYGENIAIVYNLGTLSKNVNAAIDAWYAEGVRYNYSSQAPDRSVLHFSQLVWSSTLRIGASVSTSSNGYVYVAMEFDPPGNYAGLYTRNVFPVLSL